MEKWLSCKSVSTAALLVLSGWLVASPVVAQESAKLANPVLEEMADEYQKQIFPLVQKFCVECHGPEETEAGLNFDHYAELSAVLKDFKSWEKVLDKVAGGEMPPLDYEPQPSEEEVERLAAWVETTLSSGLCSGEVEPGHVTIRRLNRAEYDNTIRDLVGVDFHPSDDFPTDDVGYGFDNIGDVLTLSPLLLEKYLSAAEGVAERAILTDRTAPGEKLKWKPGDLKGDGDPYGDGARILATEGTIWVPFESRQAGWYTIRVRAFGQQAGALPVKMAIKLGDQEIKQVDVTATEGEPQTFGVEHELPAGELKLGIAFLNDYYNEKERRRSRRDRNLIVQSIEVQSPPLEGGLELPESHRRIIFREPADATDRDQVRACATEVMERFASQAYRRPASSEEVARLVKLVELGMEADGKFESGVQVALTAVLVSPHFLFRVELDPDAVAPGEVRPLTGYELASRLSYFLWSSMPDEELFEAARSGRLQDDQTLEQQVERMLADPKVADGLVENFAVQWLQLRSLPLFSADPALFPDFNEQLRDDMLTETRLCFERVARNDLPILEFLDSRVTVINERLAKLYGVEGVEGDEFREVRLPDDSARGGLLTQASVLAVTSNPTRTSPVKRGKWIMEAILGTPPPPPPPDVPQLSESAEAVSSGSLRERLEQHRANPSCAVCHDKMDTLGFGFENFNAIGAWRDRDGEFAVDSSGTLPDGRQFGGPAELKRLMLAQKDQFTRSLTEKMLTYALGRGLEITDRCVIDQASAQASQTGYRFSTLVKEVVKSAPFRMTRGTINEGPST